MKSLTAEPSRRNSGFDATEKRPFERSPLWASKDSRTRDSTQLPQPIGTVDLLTTTVKEPPSRWPIAVAAARR